MDNLVLVDKSENWAKVTLNRPERLNSFTDELHVQLMTSLKSLREEANIRALLLTGAGRGFCAGQDLSKRDPSSMVEKPNLSKTLKEQFNPLVSFIKEIEIPVVCAVNGVAAGAGVSLALSCDIVLASDDAKFIQSFVNVGLIPDAGGTWSLSKLIGNARAKGLALTGEPIGAEKAEAVQKVVNELIKAKKIKMLLNSQALLAFDRSDEKINLTPEVVDLINKEQKK